MRDILPLSETIGPPKASYPILKCYSAKQVSSSPSNHVASSSNTLHHQTLAFQVMMPCPKREEYHLQRKTLGLGRLVSHLQWIIKCLQRQRSSSRLSQGEGVHHPTCGLHAPNEGPRNLVPSRSSFHMLRTCKDKQVRPPRVHKSKYHAN
jgi:hypothetical protein